MPNPYATQEPPELLWLEKVTFVAVYLGAVAYGFTITVTVACSYYLIKSKARHRLKLLVFALVLFGLGSLNIALNMQFTQEVYIDNRAYPGGPLAYLLEKQALAADVAGNAKSTVIGFGNAESIVISFLADGLLIYRVHAIYSRWWILPIPVLAWLAALVFGILTTIRATHPSLWASSALDFSVPYFSITMSLNVSLTCLLVGRLLYLRRHIMQAIGAHHGRMYSNIASILLESALPYGVISLIFVSLYGSHKTAANLFIPLYIQIQCISPILIILHVVRGRTGTVETISKPKRQPSKVHLGHSDESTTRDNGSGSHEVMSMLVFKPSQKQSTSEESV